MIRKSFVPREGEPLSKRALITSGSNISRVFACVIELDANQKNKGKLKIINFHSVRQQYRTFYSSRLDSTNYEPAKLACLH